MPRALGADFYDRSTEHVARDLLGAVLVCTVNGITCRGRIVETEAYLGEHDPACHAAVGRTARTEGLYARPGVAYVYRIYGMYWCANVVTRALGLPSAVLLRAVEPLSGIETMRRRRSGRRDVELTSGPGRLCDAFGITGPRFHGRSFLRGAMRIVPGDTVPDGKVAVTPRVGINATNAAVDWPMRWIVRDSPYVSARSDTKRWLAGG